MKFSSIFGMALLFAASSACAAEPLDPADPKFSGSLSALLKLDFSSHELVSRVTELTGSIQKDTAIVSGTGEVPTLGWKNPTLVPVVYVQPPADGIWEFQFTAEKPTGIAAQQVVPLQLPPTSIAISKNMKGIRVTSASNEMELRFLQQNKGPLPTPVDKFEIKGAKLKAKLLEIEVQYVGGATRHDFELHWDGAYRESNPPVAVFLLVHKDNNDPAEGIIKKTLKFALPEMQPGILKIENGFGQAVDVQHP